MATKKRKTKTKTKAKKKAVRKRSPVKKAAKNKTKRKRVGRKRLLEQNHLAIQKKLVKALKEGYYTEDACIIAGCAKSSYYRWIEEGEKLLNTMNEMILEGKEPPEITDRDMMFLEFWEAIRQAEISIKGEAVKAIKKAFKQSDGWRAAIAFLERRFPKEWGKTSKMELSDPEGKPIGVQIYLPDNSR